MATSFNTGYTAVRGTYRGHGIRSSGGGGGGGKSSGGGSSAGAIKAGGAFVELFTKDTGLASGLKAASAKVKEWGIAVAKAAAVGVGAAATAIGASIGHFVSRGDSIKKASDRLGIGAEVLSALGYAAEQSGSDLEGLEKGMRKLQQNVFDAATGGKEAAESFATLGLEAGNLLNMKPEDQWLEVADALSKVENVTERNARAMKAFGKTGTELIPLLLGGTKGVRGLMDEAGRAGRVVTDEQAASAEKLGDAFERVWASIKGLMFQVGAQLVPITDKIETISFFLIDLIKYSGDWLNGVVSLDGSIEGLSESWGAFADAVAAGDVELAMAIAAEAIEQKWSQMYDRLRDMGRNWQIDQQTNIANWLTDMGDQLEGTWFHRIFDPDSFADPSLRGPKSDDVKKNIDEMNKEAKADVVSPEEAMRRKERDDEFAKNLEKRKSEAAKEKEIAEAVRAAQLWGAGGGGAANRQIVGASSRGSFNPGVASQFFGSGGVLQDIRKQGEEQNGLIKELLAAMKNVPLARL